MGKKKASEDEEIKAKVFFRHIIVLFLVFILNIL
jgi:hypothetical protein